MLKPCSTSMIKHWKYAGVYARPNGYSENSNFPIGVTNVDLGLASSDKAMWW